MRSGSVHVRKSFEVAREMSRRAGTEVMPLVPACDRDASVKYVAVAAGEISSGDEPDAG